MARVWPISTLPTLPPRVSPDQLLLVTKRVHDGHALYRLMLNVPKASARVRQGTVFRDQLFFFGRQQCDSCQRSSIKH